MKVSMAIPIVLICDDGYVIPTCVAISSIISSKNTDTYYDIYIICASLSEESEAGFLSLSSDTVSIHILRENADRFSDMHVFIEGAMCVATTSALLKFILPDLLPQYDKVLYLDGDILVRTDLSELYSIDLGDNLLAAAADSSKLYSNLDLVVAIDHYFNAGVMLLNLKQMRLENTTDKLIQTKKESTDSSLMDQNIFNIVCEHRVQSIPVWYNFLATNLKRADKQWTIDKFNNLYGTDFKTKEDLFSAWKIVHFASKDKPWKNPSVKFADEWFEFYRTLPATISRIIPDFPINNSARISVDSKVIDERNNFLKEGTVQNKGIPIVLICDDNYVIPTSVTISTMISSKKVDTCYDIYIVCASLSEANEDVFSRFASETVAVHIIREDVNKFSELHGFTNPTACVASPAALLKFALPDIFKDYEKLLYLDGDLLVRTDLADLYNIELGDNLVAAVLDSSATYKQQYQFVPYYFNSGVMVLNIKQMRLENTKEALIKEKIEHGVTYLMDQHAFNYVCTGRIHKLPIRYNLLSVILDKARDKWTPELINKYYGTGYTSQDEVLQDGAIIHFASKDKPWKDPFVMYAGEWFEAYRSSAQIPHTIPDYPEILNNTGITVSLTSYPERIGYVSKVVDCLCAQSVLPDRIVVYLAKWQFLGRNTDLPDELLKQVEGNKVEIRWCDLDLKPHKKYYYAMQEYPDDVIITVDDDVYLPSTAIEELLLSWLHNPKAIAARRTHLITFNSNGEILPYSDWIREYNILPDTPSMQLIGTGCSGILYPPHLLPSETFNAQAIREIALYADDLWLKAHEALHNIPTVPATTNPGLKTIEGSQESALWHENDTGNRNTKYLQKISRYIDKRFHGENILQKALYSSNVGAKLTGQEALINFNKHQRRYSLGDGDTAKLVEIGKAQLTARIDVKLFGDTADFDLKYISDERAMKIIPDWFQKGGKGYQIETRKEEIDISFNVKTDGKLDIYLKGKDIRDADGIKRLPYWVNYNMLTYNGVTEFAKARYAWHDKPVTISRQVKAGETVNLHIEWQPCKVEDPELPKCLEGKLKSMEKKLNVSDKKLRASLSRETSLKNSVSFRTGRAITWLPRKVRGGIRCYKQHGPVYTLKRICWHISHK